MNISKDRPKYQYILLRFLMPMVVVLFIPLLSHAETSTERPTVRAFVYTEVQNSVPFDLVPWKIRNPIISSQPGFISKTWLSGLGNNSVGGFYSFDSLENAQKYVTEFFPSGARKQDTGHTTRIFDAVVVEEASRDMKSAHFGSNLSTKPEAFVYTELQINIPFTKVPWKKRNPIIKKEPGLLSKTWLSGVNTNTVGGIYAFDTIENAKHYALVSFPKTAKKMNVSMYIRIFDARVVEEASRGMNSPFFTSQIQNNVLNNSEQSKNKFISFGGECIKFTRTER